MLKPLSDLSGTVRILASQYCLALRTDQDAPTGRTRRRHLKLDLAAIALRGDDLDDLGNHLARALNDHGVADPHVLAADLVFVVQCRARDDDACDGYWLQVRDRSDRAGAADLHLDAIYLRADLKRRVFVGDRPAWGTRVEAQ